MSSHPINNKLGVLWMLGAAAAFTGLYVAVRELGTVLPTFQILFFRSFFSLALMLPWIWQQRLNAFKSSKPKLHLIRGFSTFIAMSMMFYGVANSPLADASALQSTYPLFTIVLAMILLGERPGIGRWVAALIGFLGIMVIVRPGFTEVGWPTLALLGCSVFYAVSNTIVKLMAGLDHPTQMVFSVNLTITILAAIPAAYNWVTPPLEVVPWIGLLALTGYTAHMCLTRSLSHGEASVVMPFDYVRLPFAAIVGFILYVEVPDAFTITGGLIIFASVSYIAAAEARSRTGDGQAEKAKA